jgi:hypothetical protein
VEKSAFWARCLTAGISETGALVAMFRWPCVSEPKGSGEGPGDPSGR